MNSPFKIIHVIPSLAKGGAEKMVLDFCEEISKREGFEVKLLVLSKENTFDLSDYSFEVKFFDVEFRFSIFGKNLERNVSELYDFFNGYSPNVIHSHLYDAEQVCRIKPIKGVRYFSHAHFNTVELKTPAFSNLFSKKGIIDFLVYRNITKVYSLVNNSFITISQDTHSYYLENIPQFKSRIHFLLNAINTKNYEAPFRKREGRIRIISVGSLNDRKNQILQLKIAEELLKSGHDFELNIFGEGRNREMLENEVQNRGLSNNVKIRGNSNKIPHEMKEHHFFIHTAKYEPFGLVLIEAMASGLPVISLDGGGNRELINDSKDGFLINSEDPQKFAEIIQQLWNDNSKYDLIAEAGKQKSLQYDIVPYIDKLLKLYSEA